jgi:hypothetical protein
MNQNMSYWMYVRFDCQIFTDVVVKLDFLPSLRDW